MGIPARTWLAAIGAPAIAALVVYLLDSLLSGSLQPVVYLSLTVKLVYLFALLPTLVVIICLKRIGRSRFWHFVSGAIATTAIAVTVFLLYSYDLDLFWAELGESWLLFVVGGVTGALTWLVSEWRAEVPRG